MIKEAFMSGLRLIEANLFGENRVYTFEGDAGSFNVDCRGGKCSSEIETDFREVTRFIKEFETKILPEEIKKIVAGIHGRPELILHPGQVCSAYMFGESGAGFFEPSAAEFSVGKVSAVDIDSNGTTDGVMFVMSDGAIVAISTYDMESMSKKPYAEFNCADPDLFRRGVESYLSPFDRFFQPTFSGVINVLLKTIGVEEIIVKHFSSETPQVESASNE